MDRQDNRHLNEAKLVVLASSRGEEGKGGGGVLGPLALPLLGPPLSTR